ncbi:MAG: hypothetical protein KAR83_01255 [Thermodesulfovibrionales bacterium]|nr:hypothetical protein [Thermodesulfovibrionales bacterium]
MNRKAAIILLISACMLLFGGCGYYEDYKEVMAIKQKYDQALKELKAAEAELAKVRTEMEELAAENKALKEQLERYAGGVKKMYE